MDPNEDDLAGLEENEGEQGATEQEIEQEAKALGWVPEDKFRGDKAKWVNAAEFMERGEKLLPLLKANNTRLRGELLKRDQKLVTLETKLNDATTAIDRLEKHYSDTNKRLAQESISTLKSELVTAREDNDVDKELEILEKIRDLTDLVKKDPPAKKPAATDKNDGLTPDFIEWQAENDWYGTDKKRTLAINKIAKSFRDTGEHDDLAGRDFMDKCMETLEASEAEEGEETPRRQSKVSAPSSSARSSSSRVKGWADLPKEAQQACLGDVDTLVGEGKLYKTTDEWKKQYIKMYFAD